MQLLAPDQTPLVVEKGRIAACTATGDEHGEVGVRRGKCRAERILSGLWQKTKHTQERGEREGGWWERE